MNEPLYDALIKARAEQEKTVQKKIKKTRKAVVLCEHVVAYRNQPVQGVRTGFMHVCNRAGIKDVTPHTLRHTAGTLMALAGVDFFISARF